MATLTLTQTIAAVRERADMVGSSFITDTEFTSYINQSYQELYDILVQKYGDDYFVASPYSVVTDGINDHYALPATFQKLLGVDLLVTSDPNSAITLTPFNFSDRNRYSAPNLQSIYGVTNLRYRLSGNDLWINPLPAAGQTLKVWYVPQLAALTTGSDTLNNLGGWLEYVIVDACIKALTKEESDVTVFMAQKMALIQRIESAAENRDAGSPATVSDTQGGNNSWGGPGDWGNY